MTGSDGTLWPGVMETTTRDSWEQGCAGGVDIWLCLCLNSLTTAIKLSSCEVYQVPQDFWTQANPGALNLELQL